MGILYLVSTPIGNLADITLRALDVLWSVDTILCEDTRTTQVLLNFYKERMAKPYPPLLSYTEHNEGLRIPHVLMLLSAGKNFALVSDRGTPLISDPGYKLVREVISLSQVNEGVQLDVIPGANAALSALLLSGFPPDKYYFVGFLSKSKAQRVKQIESFPTTTVVIYESPKRLLQTVKDIQMILGTVDIAVCSEMTKLHQKVIRIDSDSNIEDDLKAVKGEFVIVVNNTKS